MATSQEISVREKKELAGSEKTVPGRYYIPSTDVYETEEGLTLVMEMPGVDKDSVDVSLENDILRVDGTIDFARYRDVEPVYTEYNVGHFTRSFSLSDRVDRDGIAAKLNDGVLTLTLPKSAAARPRRISIS